MKYTIRAIVSRNGNVVGGPFARPQTVLNYIDRRKNKYNYTVTWYNWHALEYVRHQSFADFEITFRDRYVKGAYGIIKVIGCCGPRWL